MNKYKESFERIKEECSKLHNFDIVDDFINLKNLVEKATTKKIIKDIVYSNGEHYLPRNTGLCPKCHSIVSLMDRYCPNCGQRIDTIVGDEDE